MKRPLCLFLSAWLLACAAQAQTAPDTDTLIRLLKPGTTRGLRNLQVQAVPPAATPAPATAHQASSPAAVPASNVATHSTPPAATPQAPEASHALPIAAPVAPVAPAPVAPLAVQPEPSVSLAIQFEYNSARVSAESRQTLQQLAQALQSPELAAYRFRIEGHTDAKGQAGYNRKLSQARADEVRQLLIAQGVAAERLSSIGLGSSQLALPSQPYAAENRRVRIVNLAP